MVRASWFETFPQCRAIAGALSLRERVGEGCFARRKGESTMPVFLIPSRLQMVLPVEIPPVIPTTDICRNTDILVCAPNRHSCLFPDRRLKARWAHRLQAYVPLTLPSARRAFSNDDLAPFAPSAGALLRICFPARRSGERAVHRQSRRLESYDATLPAMFPRRHCSWG